MVYVGGMNDRCVVRLRRPSSDTSTLDPETFLKVMASSAKLAGYLIAILGLLALNQWGSIFLAGYVARCGAVELRVFFALVRSR